MSEPISRGEASYIVQQLQALQEEVAQLRSQAVRYPPRYTVTAVDPATGTFTVAVEDEYGNVTQVSGMQSPDHFMPQVGDSVQLAMVGAQPLYQPERVGAGAIDWPELAQPVVNEFDVVLTAANGKNKITYSANPPSGSGGTVGDTWFQREPGLTNVPLGVTRVGASPWVAPASGTAVAPAYPAGLIEGDQVYAILAIKPDTATVATPANWTLVGASPALGAGTQGAGTGAVKVHVYKRAAPSGGLTGTQSFTITGGSSPVGHMRAFRIPTEVASVTWSDALASFSRTTAVADIDGTTTTAVAGQQNDEYAIVTATSDDAANQVIIAALAQAGLTFDTVTQLPAGTVINAQGNDISAAAAEATCIAGSSTAALTVSGGLNVAKTNGTLVLRVRAVGDYPPTNAVIAGWRWDGTTWQPQTFDDGMFGTISAGKIVSGWLDVATAISVGDPLGQYTQIGGAGVAVYEDNPQSLTPRQIALVGKTIGGDNWYVDPAGVGNLQGLNVLGDPTFGGVPLSTMMSERGRVVARTANWANPGSTTSELGMIELGFTSIPGHLYEVVAAGMVGDINGADNGTVWWFARYTTDGSAPTITSPVLGRDKSLSRFDIFPWENIPAKLTTFYVETNATPRTVRVGLSFTNPAGATSTSLRDGTDEPRIFMIKDLGVAPSDTGQPNGMSGTSSSGAVPPPPNTLVDDEVFFDASWGRIFTGDGTIYTEGSNGMQGQSLYAPYGNMRTFVGFPDMTASMAGATIRYIKLWTYWNWWAYDDGGHPVISTHGYTAVPATYTGQYPNGFAYQGGYVGINAGVWIDLPSTMFADFASGVFRGVVLGPGPTSDLRFHGKFNGPGAPNAPRIAIGRRK